MKRKSFLAPAVAMALTIFTVSCLPVRDDSCWCRLQKATVIFTGAPEVDGCGWLIRIGSESYHPTKLDELYRIDGLPVRISWSPVEERYYCGDLGSGIASIHINEISIDAPEVEFLPADEMGKYVMDPFRLDSAYVRGDLLFLHVAYGGGCEEHDFRLWQLPPNALDPPTTELALSHDAKDDRCEAWLTRWLVFSLQPLQEKGKSEIEFLLRGSPEMSAYFGKFTYRYH
jgi:hypothetical protein